MAASGGRHGALPIAMRDSEKNLPPWSDSEGKPAVSLQGTSRDGCPTRSPLTGSGSVDVAPASEREPAGRDAAAQRFLTDSEPLPT